LTGLTAQRKSGCFAALRCERGIPEASPATPRDDETCIGDDEIGKEGAIGGHHLRPRRHGEFGIGTIGSAAVSTLTRFAIAAPPVRSVVVVQQRAHIPVNDDDDIAAVPTIAPVGATQRFELLAKDRRAPVPTVATTTMNSCSVNERCHVPEPGVDLSGRDDIDDASAAVRTELHDTRGEGEERVVSPTSHVATGVEVGTALANDDFTGVDFLTAKPLHPEALCVGIAPVACARSTLFMRHGYFPALMSVIVTVVVSCR
jgi:hypothetical protein